MRQTAVIVMAMVMVLAGCASHRKYIGGSEYMKDVSIIDTTRQVNRSNAEEILLGYIIDFTIPNPLAGGSGGGGQSRETVTEGLISCRAALLDDYSTEADILFNCPVDSTSADSYCGEFSEQYRKSRVREGMFRILIEMESGFSDKSMEPKHWAMYLETPDGVMVEPVDIVASPVISGQDSIYSDYYRRHFTRKTMKRSLSLYFQKTTFFGKDLLKGDNPYLLLVISHEQRTVARVAWKLKPTGE
jgi:hypothetical protein